MSYMNESSAKKGNFVFWIVFILIAGGGVFFRFYDLDLRPMHNDEGVNSHFVIEVFKKGYYNYSHENYHGPAYFYLSALFIRIFGDSEFGQRSCAAFFGSLTVLLLLFLRKKAGDSFVLLAASLTAFSPSLIFFSRYAIHETLFLFLTAFLGICIYLWHETGLKRWIYSGFAALALLIATKETYIISLASLGVGMMVMDNPAFTLRRLYRQRAHLFYGALTAVTLLFGVMTGGFRWLKGLWEMCLSVPQWLGRANTDVGHFKPFFYYLNNILLVTEPYLAVTVPAVVVYFLYVLACGERRWKVLVPEDSIIRFVGGWFGASFLIYSFVKYKTPWLVINIVFPGILFFSRCTAHLFGRRRFAKAAGWLVAAASLYISLSAAAFFNFRRIGSIKLTASRPYGAGNPLSYVHTTDGMLMLVSDIKHYLKKYPRARILIGVKQYWPLPYYFRKFSRQTGYIETRDVQSRQYEYDVMIVNKDVDWSAPGWVRKYYRLSDVQESNTYFHDKGR